MNDLQEEDAGRNAVGNVEVSFLEKPAESESDDEPDERRNRIELENEELFQMTQEIDQFSSDEDELCVQFYNFGQNFET